jgi:hypothetical protein
MTTIVVAKKEHEIALAGDALRGMGEECRLNSRLQVFSNVAQFPVRVKCASMPWHTLKAALAGLRRVWVMWGGEPPGVRVLVRPWDDNPADLAMVHPELDGWVEDAVGCGGWEAEPASGPLTPAEVEAFVAGTVTEFREHGLGDGRPVEVEVVR